MSQVTRILSQIESGDPAAEAMRRILVDQARRKQADKRGGQGRRVTLDAADVGFSSPAEELLDINDALTRLAAEDPQAARLIQLRYFAGLSIEEPASPNYSRRVGQGRANPWWAVANRVVQKQTTMHPAIPCERPMAHHRNVCSFHPTGL